MSDIVSIRLESIMYGVNDGHGYRIKGLASYLDEIIENQQKIITLLGGAHLNAPKEKHES